MEIYIRNDNKFWQVNEEPILNLVEVFIKALYLDSDTELSLYFTEDSEIRRLNKEFRNKDKPTDVLSFSMQEGIGLKNNVLGDIVVSLDTAHIESQLKNITMDQEVSFLILHGLLHLNGFDHESDDDFVVMDKKSNELWALVSDEIESKYHICKKIS